jgi:hypothetical protein
MALPVTPTPILKGKQATRFINMISRDAQRPSYPIPTPKLGEAQQLIQRYAKPEKLTH